MVWAHNHTRTALNTPLIVNSQTLILRIPDIVVNRAAESARLILAHRAHVLHNHQMVFSVDVISINVDSLIDFTC